MYSTLAKSERIYQTLQDIHHVHTRHQIPRLEKWGWWAKDLFVACQLFQCLNPHEKHTHIHITTCKYVHVHLTAVINTCKATCRSLSDFNILYVSRPLTLIFLSCWICSGCCMFKGRLVLYVYPCRAVYSLWLLCYAHELPIDRRQLRSAHIQ